jgi:hypothetical protein
LARYGVAPELVPILHWACLSSRAAEVATSTTVASGTSRTSLDGAGRRTGAARLR